MKKTMKWLAVLIAAILLLAAFGCKTQPAQPDPTAAPVVEEPTAAPVEPTAAPVEPTEAPAEPTEEPAPDTSITVVDMTGREVKLEKPAERIVALTAADCEIVYALGAGDLLVGRGEWCDYPAEVFNVTSVESGGNTNIEQILALDPDVLVMGTMAQTEEQVKQLEDAGVAVVVSDAQDIVGVYTAIEMLGKLLGKDTEAAAIIDGMKTQFAEIEANKLDGTKTVYFEVSPLEWGLWTAGSGTFMNEVAEMVGLKNCFADLEGWAQISEEQVLERNPDYIVTITMYYGQGPTPEEEIMSRPGWENVTAVQNAAILNLPNNELSRPIPRLADGAKMLYDFVMEIEAAIALAPAA